MPIVKVNQIASYSGNTLTVGTTGDTVTLASGATSSGFGRSGTVNWSSTVQTTGFTAVSGNGYFCNTSTAAFTATLPASATVGDIVAFKDYAKTWNINNLTIATNGLKIEGSTLNSVQSTTGQSITLVYVDSTRGWVITDAAQFSNLQQGKFVAASGGTIFTIGCYKTHVFAATGCFVVTCAGDATGSNSVEYMVVAGGGSSPTTSTGGPVNSSGGGGAGGFRYNYPSPTTTGIPVTGGTYPITVGSGGAYGCGGSGSGTNSVFSTITSAGGGYAGRGNSCSPVRAGGAGGSGGGGGAGPLSGGGAGNTPPTTPSQGNPGGGLATPTATYGSGGGGASAAGSTAPTPSPTSGYGGDGLYVPTLFIPTAYGTTGPVPGVRYFAGGGAGGSITVNTGGGAGGGGNSAPAPGSAGNAGTAYTGGGAGGNKYGPGCSGRPGANGGSGIVVIRYKYQ